MEPAITPFEQIGKELYYNCTECPSLIEITSLNENNNTIKFICIKNNEEKTFTVKEYLEMMEKYKSNNIIKDKCDKHNYKQYRYYCLDCKQNLCRKCIKTKMHKNHNKKIIDELIPDNEDLKIIEKRIEKYSNKMKYIKDEKEKTINKLNKALNISF